MASTIPIASPHTFRNAASGSERRRQGVGRFSHDSAGQIDQRHARLGGGRFDADHVPRAGIELQEHGPAAGDRPAQANLLDEATPFQLLDDVGHRAGAQPGLLQEPSTCEMQSERRIKLKTSLESTSPSVADFRF